MIIKNKYTDTENLVFSREIEDIFAHATIEWGKSKDDIWMEMQPKLNKTPVVKKTQSVRFVYLVKYAAAAAVVLLIVFGTTAAFYSKNIQTATAEKTFLLPDNSRVRLHANSTLSYKPLLWKFSRTTKLNGEAFFEVKKGTKFEVISEKAKTVVLGTRFTVTARDNEYFVNCEQGKVMLIEPIHKNEAVITAGEKAKLKTDNKFEIIRPQKAIPKEITSEIIKTEEETPKIKQEEIAIPAPKSDITPEPEKQQNLRQELNQYQMLNKPDVKLEVTDNTVENHADEIMTLLDDMDAKQQTANQERLTQQGAQQEPANGNSEATRNRFRNSLSKKQIEILEDNTLSREEKQKAFLKSLSGEQMKLLREQNGNTGFGSGNGKNAVEDNIKEEQNRQSKNQIQNAPDNKGGNPIKGGGGKHGLK